MKIGINASFMNDTPTGVGIFTKEVSRRICGLDRDTIVFTSSDLNNCRTIKTPLGISGSIRTGNNIKRFLYMNTALPCLIKKHNVDLLFCPITEYPFVAPSPMVITVHDLHPLYFPVQFGLSAVHFRMSLKLLNKLAVRIVVPSGFVKKELLKYVNADTEKIHVIYEGYDSETFRPQGDEVKTEFLSSHGIWHPYILFTGSLFPYKNVTTLINAFLAIKDRIPHMLLIIGKKEVSFEPLPEDERIRYMDYVKHPELPYFYSYAEMLVHPSFFEGFGITVLEAMACGIPVLSSNGGSLPEVVGNGGLFFEPKDTQKLSELILSVIKNEGLRREMIEKGFINIKRFSWDRTAEDIYVSCKLVLKDRA